MWFLSVDPTNHKVCSSVVHVDKKNNTCVSGRAQFKHVFFKGQLYRSAGFVSFIKAAG